jgi:YHS domain-containing protein
VQKNALSGKKPPGQIDDIMVKDPFCDVYFPKREGIHLNINGEDLYFCSTECRDKFIASRSGTKT